MTGSKKSKLQELLENLSSEFSELKGALVYDPGTEEVLGSTFDEQKSKDLIAVRKKYSELGAESVMEGVYPPGRWNWGLTSVSRRIMFASRLAKGLVMVGEFSESKSPSACVEELLKFCMMANEILA